jgi:hypothetical protein
VPDQERSTPDAAGRWRHMRMVRPVAWWVLPADPRLRRPRLAYGLNTALLYSAGWTSTSSTCNP